MKFSATVFTIVFSTLGLVTLISSTNKLAPKKPVQPKIQAAILLDVSGSMDGLIEQAKAQLWNMVSTMGKAKCSGDISPQIEIALYEYGRSSNDIKAGYVKQLSGFTSDLDSLSKILFSLKTNGGDEYCGQVIQSALKELQWDAAAENYRVIFIAGNEDFLQGKVLYTTACNEAKNKGVIVNTIYCGDRMQGIREHWNLNSECGNGSFTNINQNDKIDDIPTPYDSLIITMNGTLNQTYMAYNSFGNKKMQEVVAVDAMNSSMSKSAGIKRTKVKGNSKIYNQASWDLIDLKEKDSNAITKLDRTTLPDSLQKKTNAELEKMVEEKRQQRSAAQKEIETLNAKRDAYIATEKIKNATNKNNAATLESEVEKIIKEQANRFNMKIE
jgi:von Willebrand factor type A domain